MLDRRYLGKSLRHLVCISTVIGVLQFFLLIFVAGMFYPGGYDYGGYYFSDLGALTARNGEPNPVSSRIFMVTLTVIAVALIPFWIVTRSLFSTSRVEGLLSKIGSALGALSSPFIIGVAVFPMDRNLEAHFVMTLVFFSLFTLATLIYSVTFILNEKYSNRNGVLGLLLFGASMIVYVNPLAPYVALLQNILAYGYFLWILIPINLLWKYNPRR